ncbi:MAG TPA: hypothetical protein VJP77_06335, partial [Planctomycetota bacterium]|nr:hypothetical protein [Planctomycetota bacterium]
LPMRSRTHLLTSAAAALLFAAGAHAQNLPDVLVIDSGLPPAVGPGGANIFLDVLGRLSDHNGNGSYDDAYELYPLHPWSPLVEGNVNGVLYAVDARLEGGAGAFYLTNNSSGAEHLLRGVDANDDGAVDASEIQIVADLTALFGAAQNAVGVVANPNTGDVWVASDFPGGGLATWDGTTASVVLDFVANGNVQATDQFGALAPVDSDDFTRLTWTGDGVLVFIDGFGEDRTEAIFRFLDKNGDGDADADELTPFLVPTSIHPSWAQNPDFAGGVLRSLEIPNPADTGPGDNQPPIFAGRLNHLATGVEGGNEAFYFACDSSNTGNFALNEFGEGLNGLIFRAVDVNADGDVNDAGEVQQYYDGSATGPFTALDKIVGIDVGPDGAVYVGSIPGPSVWRFEDLNADGDAEDAGERAQVFDLAVYGTGSGEPGQGYTPEYSIFLNGICTVEKDAFQYAQVNAPLSGTGCTVASISGSPDITGFGQLAIGASLFTAELSGANGAVASILYIGFSSTDWQGIPLPLDLSLFGYPGCFLYQDLKVSFLSGVSPQGTASKTLTVPFDPAYQGLELPMQWVAVGLVGFVPQAALTRAMTVTIE